MPTQPWVTVRRPHPEQEYLVLVSELPLKRFRDLGVFLRYTWQIRGQLRRAPGLLGYSLAARILKRQFWTLSVWDGEAALQRFVVENPHGHVMTALQAKMGQTRFVRWNLRGSAFPPRWRDALARLDAA